MQYDRVIFTCFREIDAPGMTKLNAPGMTKINAPGMTKINSPGMIKINSSLVKYCTFL